MSHKSFKTLDEQIEILESRNVFIGDKKEAKNFLLKYGYYSVINGYKDPLLDRQRSNFEGEDVYKDGTIFSDFQILYLFDSMLRLSARDALDTAESIMKTACVYAFCYYHRETQAYLDPSSYISSNEYYDQKNHTRNLIRLLGVLQNMRDNKMNKNYIKHYIKRHGEVPLWVISQALTFGNMSAFFDLQKLEVQNAVCRNIEQSTEKQYGSLGIKDIRRDYKILTAYRNICSHGERFYCARIGKRNQYGFNDLLTAFKHVLPIENLSDYIASLLEQLNAFSGRSEMKKIIMDGLGISVDDLKDVLR